MKTIKIKPLSANKAWQGRRFKTKDYQAFEEEMLYSLPKMTVPKGRLLLRLEFGFSNKASDIDNPTKMTIDCLSKKYQFDDKMIYLLEVAKEIVPKNEEYISFELSPLD